MSLGITVGPSARWIRAGDGELAELVRDHMLRINSLLAANRLPLHSEPENLPRLRTRCRLDHMPYSWYARLQRAIAFSRQEPKDFAPAGQDDDPLSHEYVRTELRLKDSHVICQGVEGYYVPTDFPYPIMIGVPPKLGGRMIGSSQAATRELVSVAPLLGIRLSKDKLSNTVAANIDKEEEGAYYEERQAWLILFESFRLSVEYKASVCFH
jgi:hypothetical protein